METQQIRLGLPSKGRMEEETIDFLAACGLRVKKTHPRQYSAYLPAMPEILVLFQRSRDIANSVATGDIDLGITGYDTTVDALDGDLSNILIIHEALGYGDCKLVVAVPNEWGDVNDLAGLSTRAQESGELRVATKHTNAVRNFFDQQGIEGIRIVSADGALEAAPAIGYADLIADITSTGTTLRDNHLKIIKDGTIVESQAILIGNRESLGKRNDLLAATRQVLEFVEAYLRAKDQHLVFANMRGESMEEIGERIFTQTDLGGLQGPTISPIITRSQESGWFAINIVVPAESLYEAIRQIRSIGGSGVIATPVDYIFEEYPLRYQRLLEELGKAEEGTPA